MFWIPNGAKFVSTPGSVKVFTSLKVLSYISTTPAWKLVAYRKLPAEVVEIASPLYTAPAPELFTAITALVGLTMGFQPKMVPSSVANRKTAAPDFPPPGSTKSLVLVLVLNTSPVGVPPLEEDVRPGMVTTSGVAVGKALPCPLYSVATPAPLS